MTTRPTAERLVASVRGARRAQAEPATPPATDTSASAAKPPRRTRSAAAAPTPAAAPVPAADHATPAPSAHELFPRRVWPD
ncbi:hypothetical protein [Tepidimonas aquatica]|uniref:Uncharacterized protein n=1 Tax=Tepidimonas aquatica TaxID=247482 RepID=A0A554WGM4_9BURK|nr:hypothetical protein [Tepidimonas aquatica]TSE22727.1 hypothetical protein Taqua_01967 [Tepidimonas aquatica]